MKNYEEVSRPKMMKNRMSYNSIMVWPSITAGSFISNPFHRKGILIAFQFDQWYQIAPVISNAVVSC